MFLVNWFYSLLNFLGLYNKEGKILFLGLDNAGKTTLLNMLMSSKLGQYQPTYHPNIEDLEYEKLKFKAIDLGGHDFARRLWKDYFTPDVVAIVFIVDAADFKRFPEAKKEIDALLAAEPLSKLPFLVLGNKIDMKTAVSEEQLKQSLGLDGQTTGKQAKKSDIRPVEVFMCSLKNQFGFAEGFRWLSSMI